MACEIHYCAIKMNQQEAGSFPVEFGAMGMGQPEKEALGPLPPPLPN